ncbi:MAG: sigma-54-dependent Fis family transcriptional regulator [bacterium]|nr:MAG: sigma-54-dependent Fis family transcriptional regulator [bacterium]
MAVLLVIDNDNDFRKLIVGFFRDEGHEVDEAHDGEKAVHLVKNRKYDVTLADMELPSISGMDVLREIKFISPDTEVLMMTAFGTTEGAIKVMKLGAFDYIQKPFDMPELQARVDKAIQYRMLTNEVDYLRHERDIIYRYDDIIGTSPGIRKVLEVSRVAAGSDAPVLVRGEPGTGRELVAGATHYNSARRDGGFIRVNCSGIPPRHLQSDLFGHIKDAFEGARKHRVGRIEQANNGTVFLEEIAAIPPDIQEELVKFMTTGQLVRVGSSRTITANVRIMASTSEDLAREAETGSFNRDLLAAVSTIVIDVPPLRDRLEDIPQLANYFLRRLPSEVARMKVNGLSEEAIAKLEQYPWPGNIRELKNVLERAILACERDILTASDIQLPGEGPATEGVAALDGRNLKDLEKKAVLEALKKTNYVQKEAAKLLGISKRVIHYKIQQFGIKHPRWIRNK